MTTFPVLLMEKDDIPFSVVAAPPDLPDSDYEELQRISSEMGTVLFFLPVEQAQSLVDLAAAAVISPQAWLIIAMNRLAFAQADGLFPTTGADEREETT